MSAPASKSRHAIERPADLTEGIVAVASHRVLTAAARACALPGRDALAVFVESTRRPPSNTDAWLAGAMTGQAFDLTGFSTVRLLIAPLERPASGTYPRARRRRGAMEAQSRRDRRVGDAGRCTAGGRSAERRARDIITGPVRPSRSLRVATRHTLTLRARTDGAESQGDRSR